MKQDAVNADSTENLKRETRICVHMSVKAKESIFAPFELHVVAANNVLHMIAFEWNFIGITEHQKSPWQFIDAPINDLATQNFVYIYVWQ